MNTADLHPASVALRTGQIHRIRDGLGQRIEALRGCLWVTIDNDRRDIFVEPGDGFTIDRTGDTLVSALADSRFTVLAPLTWKHAA